MANRRLALLAFGTFMAWSGGAAAQVVQGCGSAQYLDRTAPGADRELHWDFGIENDPEHCLQVRVGQSVFWNGDLDNHPLGGQGGDTPNPISLHVDGSVTFNTPGTFGYKCLSHSGMIGAIRVVPAAAPVPALAPPLFIALTLLVLGGGFIVFQNQRGRGSAAG
jgi:plastocyanin